MPMRTHSTLLAVLGLTLTLALAPTQASASSQDVSATHAYIEANFSLAQAMVASTSAGQKKIVALKTTLAHECPGIGAGSLQNEASQPISHEVAVALWSIEFGTDAGPIGKFQQAAGRLHWSNSATNRAATKYARTLHELATIPPPNLCADVRAWKATGFTVISPAVLTLVDRVEALQPKAISTRLLAPFERGGDAAMLKRTARLEQKIEENEFLVGQIDWLKTLETLGLQQ
jgi:hypothetical protein